MIDLHDALKSLKGFFGIMSGSLQAPGMGNLSFINANPTNITPSPPQNANSEINNSQLNYNGEVLYVRPCKDNQYEERYYRRLEGSVRRLVTEFPRVSELGTNLADISDSLFSKVFVDGLNITAYVTKFSQLSDKGKYILAIRPAPDYMASLAGYFPPGVSLAFKGYTFTRRIQPKNNPVYYFTEFIIDEIYTVIASERLEYEASFTASVRTPVNDSGNYSNPWENPASFLNDIAENAKSLTAYSAERLSGWEEYLEWKEQLDGRRLSGVKYYKREFDESAGEVTFLIVCDGDDAAAKALRILRRDIAVYPNEASQDSRVFHLKQAQGRNIPTKATRLGSPVKMPDMQPSSDIKAHSFDLKFLPEIRQFSAPRVLIRKYQIGHLNASSIPEDGFLAPSDIIGSSALRGRMKKAIDDFKSGMFSLSPRLPLWLFDISQARSVKPAKIPDDEWMNQNVRDNPKQREAVEKMLAVQDVCLVQGPPGTGKTTVIAEAIYQFARRGLRVMLTSQSNDAVNNALDRLPRTTAVRPVRFARDDRSNEDSIDDEEYVFDRSGALRFFYASLADSINETWLNMWSEIDGNLRITAKDESDAQMLLSNIKSQGEKIRGISAEIIKAESSLNEAKANHKSALERNNDIMREKNDIFSLRDRLRGEIDTRPKLPERYSGHVVKKLKPILDSQGVIDIGEMPEGFDGLNDFLDRLLAALTVLDGLAARMSSHTVGGNDTGNELEALREKIAVLNEKLSSCSDNYEADSIESELLSLEAQEKELMNPSTFSLRADEAKILRKSFAGRIGDEGAKDKIASAVKDIRAAFDTVLDEIERLEESRLPENTGELQKKISVAEANLKRLTDNRKESESVLASHIESLRKLCLKYGAKGQDDIMMAINARKHSLHETLSASADFRRDTEDIMRKFVKRLTTPENISYDIENYQETYIQTCNIAGVSCTYNMSREKDLLSDFDVVIVDEVSKATPPELLIPLMRGRKVILVGDHRQLPPMFDEQQQSYGEVINEIAEQGNDDSSVEGLELLTLENFERFKDMVTSSLFKEYFERADTSLKCSLTTQYRMHSDIMSLVNYFYENRLNSGLKPDDEASMKSHNLNITGLDGESFIRPESHAYWIDSSFLPSSGRKCFELSQGTSKINILEQYIVIELLKKISQAYSSQGRGVKNPVAVGVISLYGQQVLQLRRKLRPMRKNMPSLKIDVNTVDRFQGSEREIIIVSMVRNPRTANYDARHVAAFERINVAFSRAQKLLLIVGAKDMYDKLPVVLPNMDSDGETTVHVYRNIIHDLQNRACFMPCAKIISPEIERKISDEIRLFVR
ncbi:MAG: AAA family ATPase [Synergistaceae bacterium]|nr:AAA family ATPase [Synergistaceae bacterium]